MRQTTAIIAAVLVAASVTSLPPAMAGHELAYSPSFYPHEIHVQAMAPDAAGGLLRKGTVHAYIGEEPFRAGKPEDIGFVEFLGSYLIATFDGAGASQADRDARCALASRIPSHLARPAAASYTVHPYPVTPYHADYLYHVDRVESWKGRFAVQPAESGRPAEAGPRLRPRGRLAERLVSPLWRSSGQWDATIEEIEIDGLLAKYVTRLAGWWGPPWFKEGWFHAYLLLAEKISDGPTRQAVEALVRRLMRGSSRGPEDKLNLERQIVALLTQSCEVAVLGYTSKREYFNAAFAAGIENIAFDSHSGLGSPIFIRTAKLKDFPWNGVLRLGIDGRPGAAWNPIAGFTDRFGRVVWSAVSDPALLPAPYGAGWIANRVVLRPADEPGFLDRMWAWLRALTGRPGVVGVPRDALIPETGTGLLRHVGRGKTARTRIVYRVLTSSFHDGTPMGVADVLYPYSVAYKWGAPGRRGEVEHDEYVEQATTLLRDWLVGIRVARIETKALTLGDLKLRWQDPIVEVYLDAAAVDRQQEVSVAPPWASVPWHVMALMEEAVRGRMAAFSEGEARRRGVEWLDLVRSPALKDQLARLVETFEARGHVPEALSRFVTPDEARQRWRALKRFYRKHGHFLVTGGPYRLEKWTEDGAVLSVFRDLSYPLIIGAFDAYPIPRRGYVAEMHIVNGRLQIRAEVELVEKYARSYRIVREPLADGMLTGSPKVRPVCRYLVVGADGQVLRAGDAAYAGNGTFAADLMTGISGPATVVASIYVDDNFMNPQVQMLRYEGR